VAQRSQTAISFCIFLQYSFPLSPPLGHVLFRAHRWPQIQHERQDVKGEDQGNDPLDDSGDILVVMPGCGGKDDGKGDLDDDEYQFDPEGETKNAMLAVVNAQTLVFGAKKDCTEDVAAEEQEEATVMDAVVVVGVEVRQEDEA